MEPTTRVDLPSFVREPFEVFVNGVPQVAGKDYDVVGASLVFNADLASEGKLGFWRWLSMLLGIFGTYRKNDKIDVVFTIDGRRQVVPLTPPPAKPES
jgi:hypothetical protein